MAVLLLHSTSGQITPEAGSIDGYAGRCGFDMMPAILDGDVCVKLFYNGDWVATAQFVAV